MVGMRLELDRIGLSLGGEAILADVTLALADREVTALIGPSGVGKSTLLRIIAGLIGPSAGTRRLRGRVATIFQEPRLLPWQSALDNAAFGLRAAGIDRRAARQRAADVLDRLRLRGADQLKRPASLSGGMRQRVAIARALAVEPDLLLMDEPFTGLDVTLRHDLRVLVRDVVEERRLAAIVVTHDPVEAVALCDRVIVLGGRPATLVADLTLGRSVRRPGDAYRVAAELMGRPEVARSFGAAADDETFGLA